MLLNFFAYFKALVTCLTKAYFRENYFNSNNLFQFYDDLSKFSYLNIQKLTTKEILTIPSN